MDPFTTTTETPRSTDEHEKIQSSINAKKRNTTGLLIIGCLLIFLSVGFAFIKYSESVKATETYWYELFFFLLGIGLMIWNSIVLSKLHEQEIKNKKQQ